MGGICTKDIHVIDTSFKSDNNNSKSNENITKTQKKTKPEKNDELDAKTSKHLDQAKISSNEVTISQTKHLSNKESNLQGIKSFISNKSGVHAGGRKNSKKQKVAIDSLANTEQEVLKVIKKNNNLGEDSKLIDSCVSKHFFMRVLDRSARSEIVKEMTLCYVPADKMIFSQGSLGNYFYILKEGEVDIIINGKVVNTLKSGDNFGELALLHGATRSGSAKALTNCFFWVLERKNFRKIVDHINQLNFEENKKFIQSIHILANLENDQKALLCTSLIKEVFEEGAIIVKEGEQASCIYIVKEGEVNCLLNGNVIRTLYKGDHFGERAILIDSTRSMDVVASTTCTCFVVSIDTLRKLVGEHFRNALYLNFIKSSFACSKYFQGFNLRLLDKIFQSFKPQNYSKNEIVFPKGYNVSSKFVIIIDGNLMNEDTKEIVANRGEILFENELINNINNKIDYALVANPDCLLIETDTEILEQLLGGTFKQMIGKSFITETLQKVPLFRNLTQKKIESLCDKIQIEKVKEGQNIMTQGEEGTKFYIVKSGKLDIKVNNNYMRTISENDYFGERALFFKEPRSATIVANDNCELFILEKENFLSIIESNMKEFLMNRLYLQDNTVELKELDYVKQLGSGNYGNVSLVQSKKNNFMYAIKGISKKQIDYEQLHKNLKLERSILLQIDHPFIVKLVKTLKDNKTIFFLMEYIKGREMFDVIRDIGLLNKAQTQFYGASMMLVVEYLHERKFIYRDIKPENIVVVHNGYIKLIDFGTAKAIEDRTSTIIGTPHYMAPEVILGEGYSFQVDYWSIAICLYEFVCGGVAFGESADDPMDVYLSIINETLAFPSFAKDKEFKAFISLMLSKNPLTRLCKLSQIKGHIWFQGFNWDNLISMSMEPAHIPKNIKEEEKKSTVSFLSQLPVSKIITLQTITTEYEPSKEYVLDRKKIAEYDRWFESF